MRTLFSIIALFSLGMSYAQSYTPSYGKELPRGGVLSAPTQQEAETASGNDNRYLTRLGEWTRTDNIFSTPFTVPFAWANRQIIFQLDHASSDYEVRVNGRTVAYDNNGNAPAGFNITKFAKEGANILEIALSTPPTTTALESWKSTHIPAIGPAYVMSQPTMRVRDILTRTWQSDTTVMAEVGIVVKSDALNPRTSRIYYDLLTPSGSLAATGHKDMTLNMRQEDTVRFLASIPANLLWSIDLPTRYTLRIRTMYENRAAEYLEFRPGFRTFEVKEGQIAINGRPVSLRVRDVQPSITQNEAAQLRDLGYNCLRLQPGPVSESLLDFCDAQGILVIAQAPIDTRQAGMSRRKGGNPSNDPAWLGAYLERTADSYHTTKRHPSVVAFSMALKSANGINLYESFLNMKHFGDPRPILYFDAAGEWNTDQLVFGTEPGTDM